MYTIIRGLSITVSFCVYKYFYFTLSLTLSDASSADNSWNILERGEIAHHDQFLHLTQKIQLHLIITLPFKEIFYSFMFFKLSAAICWCGKGLNACFCFYSVINIPYGNFDMFSNDSSLDAIVEIWHFTHLNETWSASI